MEEPLESFHQRRLEYCLVYSKIEKEISQVICFNQHFLMFQTPHLVNLNEDPLMSECLLYYIKDGITK